MKKEYRFSFVALIIFLLLFCPSAQAVDQAGPGSLEFSETIVLEKQPDSFPSVWHLRLKGTQRQIGYKLAEIAKERYHVKLGKNPTEVYGSARYAYLAKNYPQLLERARGALDAYGMAPDDPSVDPTLLFFSMGDLGCSMLYFPETHTKSGHCKAVRSMDFSTGSISQLMGKPRQKGEPDLLGDIYIVESYPDDGYATLYMGAMEMLNGVWDGMNEHGVTIYGLVDLGRPNIPPGDRVIGLNPSQAMRMVLETTRDCEEAKLALLTNKIYDNVEGIHYLVGDAKGNSFIFEMDQKDNQAYIQDGNGQPHIMTNSPVWTLPPLSEFPKTYDNPYDSMNRYHILSRIVAEHSGPYSEKDMITANERVFPVGPLGDPDGPSMTFRPLWQIIYDMTDPSMKVRFWQRDAAPSEDGGTNLVMTDWYSYKLSVK